MKTLFQDKAFLSCAILFVLAAGKIVHNQMPVQHEPVEMLKSNETYTPEPFQQHRSYASKSKSRFAEAKKSRPKKGNEWIVGDSQIADTKYLEAVFNNMIEGDSILLLEGETEFNLSQIPRKLNVVIKGSPNTTLLIKDGSVQEFKSISLKDMYIKMDLKSRNTLYLGAHESITRFENVTIDGENTTFYVSDMNQLIINKSKLENIMTSVSDKAKVLYQECEFTNDYENLVVLHDASEVTVKKSKILRFGKTAFYFLSNRASLDIDQLSASNGRVLVEGSYSESLVKTQNLNLEEVTERYTSTQ